MTENPDPGRRAFLARAAVWCDGPEEALAVMRKPGWRPGIVPLEGPGGGGAPEAGISGRGTVVLRRGRDELSASVSAPAGPAVVVISEVWYPAWRAFVDGGRAPLLRAYGALRAVGVGPGTHEVRMTYDSWCLKIGLMVSCATAAFSVIMAAAFLRGRRR